MDNTNNKNVFSLKLFWQTVIQLKVIGFISLAVVAFVSGFPIIIEGLNIKKMINAANAAAECGAEGAEKGFQNIVSALVRFALDKFHEHAGLIFREAHQHRFILLEDGTFHLLEIFFALGLGGECLYIFVGLEQGLADKFCVWEGLFHVAHGAPVEFFLLLVLESQLWEYGHIVEHKHQYRVALFGNRMVFAAVNALHPRAGMLDGAFFRYAHGIVGGFRSTVERAVLLRPEGFDCLHHLPFVGPRARRAGGKRQYQK